MTHASVSPPKRPGAPRLSSVPLRIAIFFIAVCSILTGANAQILLKGTAQTGTVSAVVQTEQVRAELLAHAPDGIDPGKTVWLGLQLKHLPHWHTYWTNPGDSGLPTTLQWNLPAGLTAGDIAWPTPRRIPVGSMANFGYEDTVLLPVPLTVGKDFKPGANGMLEVGLTANWLVCRQECIPQEGKFVLQVPAQGSTASHGSAFEASRAASPQALTGSAQAKLQGDAMVVSVSGLPASWSGRALQVFPETAHIVEPVTTPQASDAVGTGAASAGTPPTQAWSNGVWSAHFPLSTQRESAPANLPVVLVLGTESLRTVATISGTWPAVGATTPVAAATTPALQPVTADTGGLGAWGLALLAAVLGGLILNLMPCVLPVLAIKVLGFARHSEHSRASQRAQGLAYTAGVVLSFVALGALMLALRASGEQLGWGFHLQSPAVLAALATLFTLLGLNLAGVFEIGSLLPHSVASMQARHPVVDAFLSGVLAVAIASPCTAPFMGASLGYAISLPAAQALGIFAALGLGLALPFLAAAWVPAVGNWLPRPGAWMDTLRRFMAFPMLATVVWLVWVLGHLSGVDGAGALLALLLTLSLLVWSLNLEGRSRTVFASISIAALLGLTGAIGPLVIKTEDNTTASTGASSLASTALWQAWAPGKVEAELAAGRPVFVDFTAAWCITCQYNKKTTLANAEVLADMRARNVTLLRADWTRRDPAITVALEALGRSGVPVYVLHQAGKAPVVFSEILDAQALRSALAAL
ncbi:thioredoxin family protein [Rhodoferax sp. AJA081-3]|uniref:protein-disulfide reductase DsbD family protein n=1 Tax=Rhodoferax sp. AJA081-3 TaxID=2752316 RepID=UPI001AE0A986|nr:thioredoxin family protein [Rhodoferax sp. AJA081-3]QTN30312.1 thioredoxin family protein [Rhodoferax sp. AJA081-3]